MVMFIITIISLLSERVWICNFFDQFCLKSVKNYVNGETKMSICQA